MVLQQKNKQPVQFEITQGSRNSIYQYLLILVSQPQDYLFRSRLRESSHLSTRQRARIVKAWFKSIGLDPMLYATHSIRRTRPALIYKRTKNLRAVHVLLGHTKLESTVRYLGVEVDNALEMAEQTEV